MSVSGVGAPETRSCRSAKPAKAAVSLRDHIIEVDRAAVVQLLLHLAGVNDQRIADKIFSLLPEQKIMDRALLRVLRVGHGREQVIAVNFAKLLGDDRVERVRDAETGDKQRRAARHADDGHPEAALVAQQVAAGDFIGKGQAAAR